MATPGTMRDVRRGRGLAGGLIGPGSGLAFVWDKALPRAAWFPQPNSGSQPGPRGAPRRRLQDRLCRREARGWGDDSPSSTQGLGPLEALRYHSIRGAAATMRRGCDRNQAALPGVCGDPLGVTHSAPDPHRGLRSVLPPGVSSLRSTRSLGPTFPS